MRLLHGRWERRVSLLAVGALEGPEARATEEHVATCATCAEDLAASRAALDLVARERRGDAPLPIPLSALVTRVRARIGEESRRPVAARPRVGFAAAALMVAALAMAATLLLRGGPGSSPVVSAPPPVADAGSNVSADAVRRMERTVAREQAARYLSEAQDVLVTVAAAPRNCRKGEQRVDVEAEARRSRELLERRALLLDLESGAVASAEPVLQDVEQVLREVASLESCARARDLEAIHREMERTRLLMKIDLMTRELQG